jgi:hypothetical protein
MSFLSEARLTVIHYLSSVIDFACHTTYLLKFEEWYTPDIIIIDNEDKSYLCESEYDFSKFAAFRNVQTGTTSVNYSCRSYKSMMKAKIILLVAILLSVFVYLVLLDIFIQYILGRHSKLY